MIQAETNQVSIYASKETVWNETPTTPAMNEIPYTSETLFHEKRTVTSNIVRADRMRDDIVEVGNGAQGDINIELKFADYEDFMEGALGNTFVTATVTGGGLASDTLHAAASGSDQVITNTNGTPFATFQVGSYVLITNATTGANNGIFRVTAQTDTTLTITNPAGVLEDSQTSTIFMNTLVNGTSKISFLLEKRFNDITQFISFQGMRVGGWNMAVAAESIVTGAFSFTGAQGIPAQVTVAGSDVPASANSVYNATANIGELRENLTALTTPLRSINFSINPNVRPLTAVANKFPIGINLGSFDITGSIEAYFEDVVLYDKFLNHNDSSLSFTMTDDLNNSYVFSVTNLKFTSSNPVGSGLNGEVIANMDFEAKRNATENNVFRVDALT